MSVSGPSSMATSLSLADQTARERHGGRSVTGEVFSSLDLSPNAVDDWTTRNVEWTVMDFDLGRDDDDGLNL
jgi:hypothetical protein